MPNATVLVVNKPFVAINTSKDLTSERQSWLINHVCNLILLSGIRQRELLLTCNLSEGMFDLRRHCLSGINRRELSFENMLPLGFSESFGVHQRSITRVA